MSRLSELLKSLAAQRGMSQADLSRKSGVSKGTVSKLFNGQGGTPRDHVLNGLAKALDVPYEDLENAARFTGREPFVPDPASDRLTPRQRDAVNEIIRLLAESEQKAGDGDVRDDSRDTAPMNDDESNVTDLGGERRRRDDWSFGHRVRGDLGDDLPDDIAAYKGGKTTRDRLDEETEEGSQDPDDWQ